MADIISLEAHRRKASPPVAELVQLAIDDLVDDWARFAKVNRLNDFFTDAAGVWTEAGVSYLSDLNAIAAIEGKVGLLPIIRAPITEEQLGWQAAFYTKTTKVHTPNLPFETYARCFNVLLFLKLKRDLLANGYTDEL